VSILILVIIIIFLALVSSFIPIGNENSTVRRLPWITFSIIALNAVIFFVTLPVVAGEQERITKLATRVEQFLEQHQEMLADESVRTKLTDAGMISKRQSEAFAEQLGKSPDIQSEYDEWLRSPEAQALRDEFDQKLTAYKDATADSLWYRYGLAPNGKWKLHQLITAAFLHAGALHLFGNLIFFFAVAFSLEDLWGRGMFLGFYLLGAAVSCLPSLIHPAAVPSIGASGAISATMGAFLFRLPKTKIKLLCLHFWLVRILFGRRPWVVMLPGYIYLASYFIAQVISWYFDKKAGSVSNIGYSIHIAGFVFGAGFAMAMKLTKFEENHINPKIEAKVSFSAAPAVTSALEALDKGYALAAEKKLSAHLARHPDDINALLTAIHVYQQTSNFDQLNAMYGRLIRHHLANHDKEAALYAYDGLLSAFPEDNVAPKISSRDWMQICEYLQGSGLNREAAVEYERLVNAWVDDRLIARAAVQGGEAALAAGDVDRAFALFQKAEAANPHEPYATRAQAGAQKCRRILDARPDWSRRAPEPPLSGNLIEETTLSGD
jgi:membrane associated rhomboid family serine protease